MSGDEDEVWIPPREFAESDVERAELSHRTRWEIMIEKDRAPPRRAQATVGYANAKRRR